MDDLAHLQIRISSLEAEKAERRLKGLERQGGKSERATDGLTASFKRFAGPAVAAAAAVSSLRKVIDVTRSFEVLNAQLITATGSAENAGIAFEAIQDFASSTPYDLQQVTEGFTKLVNLGLTPSEKALTSYGNTASAMGKDLNQLIEAVADAATGEFERLKEFGIKARSQGDDVALTFRGMTTTVGKNAAEIEQYLIGLGENEFAGAMAERMNTLDGAISNLNDEWSKVWLNIGKQGIADIIEESVRNSIDRMEEFNDMLASGQIAGHLDALAGKFDGFGRDVSTTLSILTGFWQDFLSSEDGGGIAHATKETIRFITDAFKNLPENIRAVIQLMAVEIAALVDYGKAYGEAFGVVLGAEFGKLVETSKAYGKAIGQAINPFDDNEFDLEARLKELDNIAADMADSTFKNAEKQAEATRQLRRDSILAILEERDVAIASYDMQVGSVQDLRKQYDELKKSKAAVEGDRLAEFGQGDTGGDPGSSKQEQRAAEARAKAFAKLVEDLRTEEEAIQLSYRRRLQIILENTEENSKARENLKARLDSEFATDALGDLSAPRDTHEQEMEDLESYYIARRELILNNTRLTEEQRTELEVALTEERNRRISALEAERTSMILMTSSQMFGSLADAAKGFAGEQSDIYKAMFGVSKAFALVDSAVKIQQGIANAAVLPFPANLGAMSTVAAATASIVSTISSLNFSGSYDNGGVIPSGKVGLVGEFGPELVAGPTNVTSRRETAKGLRESDSSKEAAPQPQPAIRIINTVDPELVGDYLGSSAGEQVILNTIRNNPEILSSVG